MEKALKEVQSRTDEPARRIGTMISNPDFNARDQAKMARYNNRMQSDKIAALRLRFCT